jgi:hypothetical protein
VIGALLLASALAAAADAPADTSASPPGARSASATGPDVELHVPRAEVQKLAIEVENLQARLDLDTRVAGLVQIRAGVVATVQTLRMELEGVQAESHLIVRLERVAEVMEKALDAIRAEPGLAAQRSGSAEDPLPGSVAAEAVAIPALVPPTPPDRLPASPVPPVSPSKE